MQPPIAEPFLASEIRRDLLTSRDWAAAHWEAIPADLFFAPLGERDGVPGWSPADHLRHLVKSNRPVAMALRLPKVVLLLRFGPTFRASRSYSALTGDYREALAGGLRAGRFSPRALPPEERTPEARQRITAEWSRSVGAVESAIAGWSESALDRLRLPHPGIGKLTVREMLLFTLYHNAHHLLGVARQLPTPATVG